MPTREELCKAMEFLREKHCQLDTNGDGDCGRPLCPSCGQPQELAASIIADCVPVPREELDRLERAVWSILHPCFLDGGGPQWTMPVLARFGMSEERDGDWYLTDAAYEFAERMKEK